VKVVFKTGDRKSHNFKVKDQDVAHFEQESVHEVCATFTLAREIEWTTRLFVLEMLENEEEGIGTHLNIEHLSPALLGEEVNIEGEFDGIKEGEIICNYVAKVGGRLIAKGTTGQKILPKKKIAEIFGKLSK